MIFSRILGLWLIMTAALVVYAVAEFTYDYSRPADEAYYVDAARDDAAACLTRRMCSAYEGYVAFLAHPPLGPDSRCSDPRSFEVLHARLHPSRTEGRFTSRDYTNVLLKCIDKDAYLTHYFTMGKHVVGSTYWQRCSHLSCAAEIARMPPD